jgi:hypothetical protein
VSGRRQKGRLWMIRGIESESSTRINKRVLKFEIGILVSCRLSLLQNFNFTIIGSYNRLVPFVAYNTGTRVTGRQRWVLALTRPV